MIDDAIGAFVPHGRVEREGAASGPLRGLTFAVKDLFDVAGVATGAGNPDWLKAKGLASADAPVVTRLLEAGARLVGKTVTDEMAWSLQGENVHYGAPVNVAARGRTTGGSSSGSAAAVAAGLVDFAIGSDTGGSVRLPASYCGLFGFRPTHGRVSLERAFALARSYDTAGWFARDASTLARVGSVLLDAAPQHPAPTRLLIADDLWALAEETTRMVLAPALEVTTGLFNEVEHVGVAQGRISHWREVFRLVQSAEIWAEHGAWVTATTPVFGPGVRERFEAARTLDARDVAAARAARQDIRRAMEALLPPGSILALPTVPGVAPLRDTPDAELAGVRARAIELLCPAGHAGMPQVSLPVARVIGCPVGLSLLAPRGRDETLLVLAGQLGEA